MQKENNKLLDTKNATVVGPARIHCNMHCIYYASPRRWCSIECTSTLPQTDKQTGGHKLRKRKLFVKQKLTATRFFLEKAINI